MVDNDEMYMVRCLQLAKLAAGNVAPNPMVGAVLVYEGVIIGEGYHKKFGEPHAEVNCINSVKEEDRNLVEKSTLFVSLEPCSHYGKTPPCTELIMKNKIPKVVIGCKDIFAEVDGKGIKKLRDGGIEVITCILEKECIELNKRFFTFHQKQRPYIILKWAESADGKIAASPMPSFSPTGKKEPRIFISNEFTNRLVHKWRSEEAAIMIGTNTALQDDPSLTTRLWPGKHPTRLVVDMDLRLPLHLTIFDKKVKTIVFNKTRQEEHGNMVYFKIDGSSITALLEAMYQLQIQSALVEGGTKLLQSFIGSGLWDETRIIKNEGLMLGDGLDAPKLSGAVLQKQEKLFSDAIYYFLPSS